MLSSFQHTRTIKTANFCIIVRGMYKKKFALLAHFCGPTLNNNAELNRNVVRIRRTAPKNTPKAKPNLTKVLNNIVPPAKKKKKVHNEPV